MASPFYLGKQLTWKEYYGVNKKGKCSCPRYLENLKKTKIHLEKVIENLENPSNDC